MPIIGRIVRGVGSGIGLASEAIQHQKDKKNSRSGSSDQQTLQPQTSTSGEKKSLSREVSSDSDSDDGDEKILNTDEAEWALDDAAAELEAKFGPPPAYTYEDEKKPQSTDTPGALFPRSSSTSNYKPLPYPVILPQRRPHDRKRGFVRAYAPVLESHSQISQSEFLNFLSQLDESAKTSPIFTVINVAAFAIGWIPNPIAMAVGTAVQIVNGTAQELTSRRGRNDFLDKANREFFMPRGLFCMIMMFKPEVWEEPVLTGDVTSSDLALSKYASSEGDSALKRNLKSIRLQSGNTKGEWALPEAAPLVYPALDAAANTQAPTTTSSQGNELSPQSSNTSSVSSLQNTFKSSSDFINTYLDRRARDTYAGTYPTSKLATTRSTSDQNIKPYASRFSDPNHPANSGTILGLLTGGHFDPLASKRVLKAERRARRRGQTLTEAERQNIRLGRRENYGAGASRKQERNLQNDNLTGFQGKPIKRIVRRALRQDVLYLTVVNLPSEAEMAELRQLLVEQK